MLKHKFNARTLMAGAFAIGAVSSTAGAITATSNLSVTASVTANCTITTAPVAFGAYDPIVTNASAALTGNGTLNVTCTSGASSAVTLGEGSNPNAGSTAAVPARRLKDGGTNFLTYKLFSESTRTTVWGDTTPTGLAAATGTGSLTTLTVYGAIDAGQNVPAGNYTDTVLATITF